MKYKIKEVVGNLDHTELIKVKNDLEKGGMHLMTLIDKEIEKKEEQHEKYCSICSNKIEPENINNFTLVFGPESFRKKATFCAIDCMQYFIGNLKRLKEHRIE